MKYKMKHIEQYDSMQCGAACIAMISHYYGKVLSLSYVSTMCNIQRYGVSLKSIDATLNDLGFNTLPCSVTINALCDAYNGPCILHWNQNHFVVLYRIKNNRHFYIDDPSFGKIVCTKKEFEKHWICSDTKGNAYGIALLIETTSRLNQVSCGTTKESRSLMFLARYIVMYRVLFIQIILGLIVGSVLQLALPFLTQSIVDVGIKNQKIDFVWLVLLGQITISISRTIIDFIRRWLLLHINMRVNISLKGDFLIKLLKLPMSFFDTRRMGDLLQRINDHSRVNSFLTHDSLNVFFSMITFMIFGGVLLWYNRHIFIIFTIGSILYGVWQFAFLRKRKMLDYELFEQQADNNNKTYEFLNSMQEIKLQGCEQRRRWEWEDVQANLFSVQMKTLKLQQEQRAGAILLNESKNLIITVVAASSVINGYMTLGMMLAVQYIIGQLNSPVEQLMQFLYSLQDVRISLERINEIHHATNENEGHEYKTSFCNESLGISLNNISFKYDSHALRKTIDGVNINIPHGKITAIVGASGSGKTTLIKLLLGYYPVLEGQINVGGTDINLLNKKWLRSQCGVVMQDGVIFSESIARNIAVSDGEIDAERMIKAAEMACIKDYVDRLPLGFNTKIGRDGVGLSQGQKQRILIARAIYKNPNYIFLDEATNSLDASNERAIVENLNRFCQGKTVIVVAHRLSTVRNADQIIVLGDGKIVENGTHDSLVALRGTYYNLVKNQLELGN